MLLLEFSDVQVPKDALMNKYQFLLGVEATFTLSVESAVVLVEPHFCIIELRQWLQEWLENGAQNDFIYTSIESDDQGLITFRHFGVSDCIVGSAWSNLKVEPVTS